MEFVQTKDGSFTVFHPATNEHYHSISGAEEEAFEKYVNPLDLQDNMKILDFCFGLGYNSFAAISKHKNLDIIALEKDIKILQAIQKIIPTKRLDSIFANFGSIAENHSLKDMNNNALKLILGDARKTILGLETASFDRVFFDPFSPSKVPELWSKSVFKEVFRILKEGGKLATYSCNKKVRKTMNLAGFTVIDGPCIGRKSPSTIAIK